MTDAERIAQLERELAEARGSNEKPLTLKATPKGCIGFYGIRRMPITLYPQEWQRMVAAAEEVERFIEDNRDSLSFK